MSAEAMRAFLRMSWSASGASGRDASLLKAAELGDHELVAELLEAGASPMAADKQGRTPLMLAAARGSLPCLSALLPASDPLSRSLGGASALCMAAQAGHLDCLRALLAASAVDGRDALGGTALHRAAAMGRAACVAALLAAGADPWARTADDFHPLDLAVQIGDVECACLLLACQPAPTDLQLAIAQRVARAWSQPGIEPLLASARERRAMDLCSASPPQLAGAPSPTSRL